MPKLIATMPVRNEEWILERSLEDLSTYVDEIVVVDDGSQDKTPEILRSFSKVTAIHTNPLGTKPFGNGQESVNRNKTLELARQRGAEWILQVDADEVFESRIKEEIHDLINRGCSTKFKVFHFWGDTMNFRIDGEWGKFSRYCLFKLLPRMRFSSQPIIATPRAFDRKNRYKSDIKLLHYGWISPKQREKHLRRYYEVYKIKHPKIPVSFEEFANSEAMQADLKIVKQDDREVELKTWAEIMGKESQEKYEI